MHCSPMSKQLLSATESGSHEAVAVSLADSSILLGRTLGAAPAIKRFSGDTQLLKSGFAQRFGPYLYLAPTLIILFLLIIFPLAFSLSKSFSNFNLILGDGQWTGIRNYLNAFADEKFRNSFLFTFIYAGCSTLAQLILGFTGALCLQKLVYGRRILTVLLMLPMMVTPVVVGIIWLLMFQPDYSVVNGLLGYVGIEGPIWLQSPLTARIAVITADVWQWTPFFTVIMLSGLLNLPKEVLEAGEIDGATWLQSLRLLVIPMMSPLILVTLLIRLIDSFRVFDSIFVMTNGGPGSSTEALSLYIYRTGLPFMEMGYASAMSYLFVIVLVAITTVLIRFLRVKRDV